MPDSKHRRSLLLSLAAHACLLILLLRTPDPTFIKPSSVVSGRNGTSTTQIYWLAEPTDKTSDSGEGAVASDAKAKLKQKAQLEWQRAAKNKKKTKQNMEVAKAEEDSSSIDRGGTHQAPPVGSPFGSLTVGSTFGREIRPAYPISGSDPVASFGELPSGFEGDVIVEVTINEQGNIVDRAVIQSVNPVLDAKSLAALATWRFRPATKNGVPIASKHDVYFHFRSR
jgi:TonB family protein